MSKLEGKTALVTGGGSGIGLAIARRFAAEGARVFITGRDGERLARAAAQIGEGTRTIPADVTDSADLDRLFDTIRGQTARLDVLVTASGIAEMSTLEDTSEEHFDKTFDLNVRGMFFTVQRALRLMGEGSAVVLVGSIAGGMANPGYGSYSATKAAVRSYARSWTHELAPRGIRVNVLSPGPTDTPMFDGVSEEFRAAMSARIPFGRLAEPDEVAAAALFLASDDGRFVGGAELVVDGGLVS